MHVTFTRVERTFRTLVNQKPRTDLFVGAMLGDLNVQCDAYARIMLDCSMAAALHDTAAGCDLTCSVLLGFANFAFV